MSDYTSREYKRAHPEKAREYNRRANERRTTPRWAEACQQCGAWTDKRAKRCGTCGADK